MRSARNPNMTLAFLSKFLGLILLATLVLPGCGVTTQDLRQEIQDTRAGTMEKMAEAEKSYEGRRYFGFTSEKSEEWNSTDWGMWMDTHGGGR